MLSHKSFPNSRLVLKGWVGPRGFWVGGFCLGGSGGLGTSPLLSNGAFFLQNSFQIIYKIYGFCTIFDQNKACISKIT